MARNKRETTQIILDGMKECRRTTNGLRAMSLNLSSLERRLTLVIQSTYGAKLPLKWLSKRITVRICYISTMKVGIESMTNIFISIVIE
jgi:hypothetical protein